MGYPANTLAVKHFLDDILPLIQAQQPDATLTVVGPNPPAGLKTLKRPDVTVTGWVPDIRPYLSAAHVVVCPLKIAVGIQNKLLEAMAAAKGIVTYPGPARSVCSDHRSLFMVADDPKSFADRVIELFRSDDLRNLLGAQARDYVKEKYNWGLQVRRLERIYENALTADFHQCGLHRE
jgi:glycosyltransferase involved in cell wall biosynthesis